MPPLPEGYPDRLHPHDRRTIEEFSLLEFDEETHHRGLAAYYACVEFVDECMGELLNGLERAGLLENTVIVYVSDHGDMAREHGLWWKRTYYDASVGVPLMVSLPGQEARQDVSVPVELVDLFPTILALCGRDLPEDIDGESLLPLLAEGDLAPARQKRLARSVFMDGRENMAFRMVRTERHKYVSFLKAEPVLYDLVEDPGELHNKAADPKLQDVVRELERLLDASGTWAEIVERFGADDQRSLRPNRSWAGSPNQFQLYDGRVAHVDARLYEKAP